MTLTEKERESVKKWAASQMEAAGHAPDEFDIDAEIDSEISTSENYAELGKKMKERGLTGGQPKHQYGSRNYASDMDRQLEEDADRAYMEQRQKQAREEGPRHKEIPGEYGRKFEGNISHKKEEPLSPMATINEPEPSIMDKAKGFYEKTTKEMEYAKSKRLDERASKATQNIQARRERLAVSELERREKDYAKAEFQQSTAGRMISAIQGVGSGLGRGSSRGPSGYGPRGRTEGNYGSSLLRESILGGKGNQPGISLALGQSNRYIGENRGGASLMMGMGAAKSNIRGHYVTVVEKGQVRRIHVPGTQTGQYNPNQQTVQPATQSPLGSAMFGGMAGGGRVAEKPGMLAQMMLSPGSQKRGPDNRPTLLQQATRAGNKGNSLFSGANSKSHNSLFATAISNKSKLKWR
jgi:hypothetical protein